MRFAPHLVSPCWLGSPVVQEATHLLCSSACSEISSRLFCSKKLVAFETCDMVASTASKSESRLVVVTKSFNCTAGIGLSHPQHHSDAWCSAWLLEAYLMGHLQVIQDSPQSVLGALNMT